MLKAQKSLVWVAVTIAVASLCVAALAELQDSGIVAGGRSLLRGGRLVLYGVGAVGVISLGAAYFRLAGVVTSIAGRLALPGSGAPAEVKLEGADELSVVVNAYAAGRES
ncbi:MAG: hypothetical protein JW955_25400, partial [Sedimentisphaerales bacterium]|nr:hypothetical protein [Sedimentisphaerales bacterium]